MIKIILLFWAVFGIPFAYKAFGVPDKTDMKQQAIYVFIAGPIAWVVLLFLLIAEFSKEDWGE